MLLPRKDLDESGNEIDPREELVRQLLEYKRYKEVLDELRLLEDERVRVVRHEHARRAEVDDRLPLGARLAPRLDVGDDVVNGAGARPSAPQPSPVAPR